MVNFGPITAEICWRVRGTPASLNGLRVSLLRVLTLFLRRCRSMEVNQTLHDVWPSPGLVHFWSSCPLTEFCQVQNSLWVQVLQHLDGADSFLLATLLHGTRTTGVSQTFQRGTRNGITELSLRHLYSAGRPSRWASVHILHGTMSVMSRRVTYCIAFVVKIQPQKLSAQWRICCN